MAFKQKEWKEDDKNLKILSIASQSTMNEASVDENPHIQLGIQRGGGHHDIVAFFFSSHSPPC